jgi:hypothetical protein
MMANNSMHQLMSRNEINRSASTNSEAIFSDGREIKNDLARKHSLIYVVTVYQ